MRALALLVALAPLAASAAGWLEVEHQPPYPPGAPSVPSTFNFYVGCVRSGEYERAPIRSATARVRIEGLPDTGRCYVTSTVAMVTGETARTNEIAYDFTANDRVPATPSTAPVVTWSSAEPAVAWSKSWAFRFSEAFVTDAPGVLPSTGENYPWERGGVKYGWEASPGTRDRTKTIPELAGVAQLGAIDAWTTRTFRVELPEPGNYRVRLALGDQGYPNRAFLDITDDGRVALSIPDTYVPVGQFLDATRTLRTAATWGAQNVGVVLPFETRDFRLVLKRPANTSSVIAFLSLEKVP